MECNNKYCYWNYENMCVHEDEKGHEEAEPNSLSCPSSLRGDFETSRLLLQQELRKEVDPFYLMSLSFVDMIKVRSLLTN